MKHQQTGFTLVELIVVIVILGILAATALPRFVNLQGDARAAVMQGVAGAMESAKQLVQARWLATGSSGAATTDIGGGTLVAVETAAGQRAGLPTDTLTGMPIAITLPAAVTCAVTGGNLVCTHSTIVGCTVTYDSTTGTGPVTVQAAPGTC